METIVHSLGSLAAPMALHVGTDDLPFAEDFGAPGVRLKLLAADVEGGWFAVRIRFAPGVELPPHQHTGAVHAFTLSGEWSYLEHAGSPPSKAGSYLYEPAGTSHRLKVADHNTGETDVFFIIYGAMLVQDPDGNVVAVLDAHSHLRDWPNALRAQGAPVPPIIEGGRVRYTNGEPQ
ncbi:2,4'-dihydroxyacetophenone dioxygenase family protein [Pseudoduganella namucuonensis]|nr:2,4'-dihydroxyacetophenone dioxygenase family protein [Pseudoduganella namucuonensis]